LPLLLSISMESAADKQKRLIQQEIAKLSGKLTVPLTQVTMASEADQSGAISRHGHSGPSRPSSYPTATRPHPYASRGAPGGRGRGRGRGGYALDLRQSKPVPSVMKAATPVAQDIGREDGEVTPEESEAEGSGAIKGKGKEVSPEKESWVKKTSKGGNMSLMTVEKRYFHLYECIIAILTNSNVLASKPRLPRQPKVPPQIQVLSSTTGPSGPNRVVIDGVIFQFEEGGSKLTRIGGKLRDA